MPTYTTPATASVGALATAAWHNQYMRDNLIALIADNGLLPDGVIAMYGDDATNIPSVGWHLNDGGASTIDLRDVLVRGAGSTYAVGASGGHVSNTPSAHSSHSVTQASAHSTHVVTAPAHGQLFGAVIGSIQALNDPNHLSPALSAHSAHSGATIDSHTAHTTLSLLPPYHAHGFMQRVASGLSSTTPRTWTTGDVPTAAQLNADMRDNVAYVYARVLPANAIALWSGSIASIPTPYQICQGGITADLRDRFFIGGGNLYAHGASGGATSGTVGDHSNHVVGQASTHSDHVVTQPTPHNTAPVTSGPVSFITGVGHNYGVDSHGAHSGFSVDAHASHGSIPTVPPYVALAFMQAITTTYTDPKTWTTGEVVKAAHFNTYLRDNLQACHQGIPPIGSILHWSGSTGTVPTHWQICNGTNGTPELRDKFVAGAGLTYAVNATGGSASATPTNHGSHAVNQPSSHSGHVVTQPSDHTTTPISNPGGQQVSLEVHHQTFTVNAHSAHSGADADAHSTHSAIDTTPPYKAYAYIQRLS